jgi:FixJ family two-component response regulator
MISERSIAAHFRSGTVCVRPCFAEELILNAVPVISIIDDDESIRVGLNNLVISLEYTSCTFASAEAFLQSVELHTSWCVIADVRMPAMSGVELQSRLRSEGYAVPFIFITALPDESSRKQAIRDGAICFLTKPFEEGALIKCLNTAVQAHRNSS